MNKLQLLIKHWQGSLKTRLSKWFIPATHKNGSPSFVGIVHANNGCLLHIDTNSYIEYKVYAEGGYEPEVTALLSVWAKSDTAFLDIGANVGVHSLSLALRLPTLRVYSFEPIEFVRAKLQANIALNHLSNITVLPIALSSVNKTVFTQFSTEQGNQGVFSLSNTAEQGATVDCRVGDEVVEEQIHEPVSVIKIDVEGFEFPVLKGLSATIQRHKPCIVFEFDTHYISRSSSTAADFDSLLIASWGYKLYTIEAHGLVPCATLQHLKVMHQVVAIK